MKPVVLSTKENAQNKFGWQRDGFNISYFKNNISKVIYIYLYLYENIFKEGCGLGTASYYTLSFTYKFIHDQDTVYFAQCYPYTYSDLNNYLNKICLDNSMKQ